MAVFVKTGDVAAQAEQFQTEIAGLSALKRLAGVLVPTPIGSGVVSFSGGALFMLEAVEELAGRCDEDWRAIGHGLATVHQVHDTRFGYSTNGYFGPFEQDNRPVPSNTWAEFYAERRLRPALQEAQESGNLPTAIGRQVQGIIERLPSLIGPEPVPTLLHGDAQQSNFISTHNGAVLVDACPYFGHPELDLALVDYFEPVPHGVLDAYGERASLAADFDDRRALWRIFGYLYVVALDGQNSFGQRILESLRHAVDLYT